MLHDPRVHRPASCTILLSLSLSLSLFLSIPLSLSVASIIKFESTYRREYGGARSRDPPRIALDYFRGFMSLV